MTWLLLWVQVLALATWLGETIFFGAVVAPALFGGLSAEQAGAAVALIFPAYYVVGYVCGALMVATALALRQRSRPAGGIWLAAALIAGLSLAVCLYAGLEVLPRPTRCACACTIRPRRRRCASSSTPRTGSPCSSTGSSARPADAGGVARRAPEQRHQARPATVPLRLGPAAVMRAYRVVLFDLFGTVVHFPAPSGAPRATFDWLRAPLAQQWPAIEFEEFRRALLEVSKAVGAERALEHREIPSRERFRRALARFDATVDAAAAERLAVSHMAHLAARTAMPAAHAELLGDAARRYRLGLVSNFDHAPTARAILARYGVDRCFNVTLISDDFGRCKPHPSIFLEALTRLAATPAEALYVGDTPADDIVGARGAGLDVAWINRDGVEVPEPAPTYTLHELAELRQVLGL